MAQTKRTSRSRKSTAKRSSRRRGSTDGSPITQRKQQAAAARKRIEDRRQRMSGVAGWVAQRAGDWSLEERDPSWMEIQKYFWNPLIDYWFRTSVEGWENVPEPPTLLVGIHSGAPFVWDAWTVGLVWWRRFGDERILHGTAHDMLMATPVIGTYFRKMGVLPAAPDSMAAALAAGRDVAVWPGGEVDSLRPWTRRDEASLAGRTGFVKLAISSNVPIVPIATVGGADAMPVLVSGRRLAKALQLDRLTRLKRFPIAVQAPWGIAPAVLPEIPLPTRIRTAFQEPIEVDGDPARAEDEDYVKQKYLEVEESIQGGMEGLARHRRLPLFE